MGIFIMTIDEKLRSLMPHSPETIDSLIELEEEIYKDVDGVYIVLSQKERMIMFQFQEHIYKIKEKILEYGLGMLSIYAGAISSMKNTWELIQEGVNRRS